MGPRRATGESDTGKAPRSPSGPRRRIASALGSAALAVFSLTAPAVGETTAYTGEIGLRESPPPDGAAPPNPPGDDRWLRIVFAGEQENLAPVYDVLLQRLANGLDFARGQRLRLRAFSGADDPVAARRVALARAIAVRARLMTMGVDGQWIEVRALGSLAALPPRDRVDVIVTGPPDADRP